MIELPWFHKKLSPNTPGNWRAKTDIKKKYRADCRMIATGSRLVEGLGHYHIKIIFCPPDKRHRDLDNCLASIKSGIDGVCDAWGINDKNLRPITIDFGPVVKHGKIIIEVMI